MERRHRNGIVLTVLAVVLSLVLLTVLAMACYFAYRKHGKETEVLTIYPSPGCTKAVVIAKFKENISGLIEIIKAQARKDNERYDVYVYNKGPLTFAAPLDPFLTFHIENVPNVGRDGHTLLYHIVKYYKQLHQTTVFLPGSAQTIAKKTRAAREALATSGRPYFSHQAIGPWKHIAGFTLERHGSSDPDNASEERDTSLQLSDSRPLGVWFKDVFGYEPLADFQFLHSFWMIASLPRTAIYDRPVETYQKILLSLSGHSNPEVGHYTERAILHLTAFMPRVIWILWLQGWAFAPAVAVRVRESWEVLNPGWEVRALDSATLRKWISVPSKPGMGLAAQADVARLHLLAKHGGVWADADTLCVQPLTQWAVAAMSSPAAMWAYHGGDGTMPAPWLMLSQPGSYIMAKWAAAADTYWASRNSAADASWMEGLFKSLRDTDTVFEKLWATVPTLQSQDAGSASALMGKVYSYDPDVLAAVREHVPYALKLDWRCDLGDGSNGNQIIEWVQKSSPPPHKAHVF